jgi:hypothetical protein
MKPTKEQVEAYERVRQSGRTNMWDVKRVVNYSEGILFEEVVMEIMKNYTELIKEYGISRS